MICKLFVLAAAMMMTAGTAYSADWRDKTVELAMQEKKVVEAMFSQPVSFWVSVKDDGTNRDGFASYFCLLMAEAGMPEGESVIVSIWDAAAMAKGDMKKLGQERCAR